MSTTLASTWFISAPANPTKEETIQKLRDRLTKHEYADIFPISIPEFKVGTLDSLVVLSDELIKTDQVVEAATLKISESLKSILADDELWKQSLLVSDKFIQPYLETFSWNTMKYRSDKTLKELIDSISQEVMSIDAVIKNKMGAYGTTKQALVAMQRKQT